MKEFSKFEKIIGVEFKDKNLLKQAFTHRSYINENPSWSLQHNERLEFLGDAVLELVVTDFLYKEYPEKTEGEMTALRAALVNANMLVEVAGDISMGDFLLLSRGEAKDTGKARQFIMANAFEALIGSLYIDSGYDAVVSFLKKNLFPKIKMIIDEKLWIDAKSLFQEKAQEHENVTPRYEVVSESGPDHAKIFVVGVYLNGDIVAKGDGHSKQEAEQSAACAGLKLKNWEN